MRRVMLFMAAAAAFGLGVSGCKTSQSTATFASVEMKSLEDKDVAVADYRGKVVLVNFWATWCEPCRIEIPWLIEMQSKYADKGFTVLGIAMDEEGKPVVAPFVAKQRYDVNGQKQPMNYPVVVGNEKVAEKFGGLLGYPTSILISRDGKVLKRTTGLIDYQATTKMIEGAL